MQGMADITVPDIPDDFLTTQQAADYLKDHGLDCPAGTLSHWRHRRRTTGVLRGPKITIINGELDPNGQVRAKRGRGQFGIFYQKAHLDEFLATKSQIKITVID
jgi:hypothetical protein